MPLIFLVKLITLPPIIGYLSKFPVKKDGMVLQNSVMSAQEKYTSLLRASGELIGVVKGERFSSTANHIWEVRGERCETKKEQDTANGVKLKVIVSDQCAFEKRLLICT